METQTRDTCEKLRERPLQDDDWTRLKLPTSRIQSVTSRLEVSCDTRKKKTKTHADRIERNLTGKQQYSSEGREHEGNEIWDGTHTTYSTTTERNSRTLKSHEIITAHKRSARN